MNGDTNWANIVDENSNLSMNSIDFMELPLAKLEYTQASYNSGLDNSKQHHTILVSRDFNVVSSKANCSTSTQKGIRCSAAGQCLSDAKRQKSQDFAIGQASHSYGSLPGGGSIKSYCEISSGLELQSKRSPQFNFAEILKSTIERKRRKHEESQCFTVPPSTNSYGGIVSGYNKSSSNVVNTKDESVVAEKLAHVLEVGHAPSVRRETSLLQYKSICETKQVDLLQSNDEPKKTNDDILVSNGGRKSTSINDQIDTSSSSQGRKGMIVGISRVLPSVASMPESWQAVWEMPRRAGIIIAHSQFTPDFFIWGRPCQQQDIKLFEAQNMDKKKETIESDSHCSTLSLSAVSPTLSQVDGSSSIEMEGPRTSTGAISFTNVPKLKSMVGTSISTASSLAPSQLYAARAPASEQYKKESSKMHHPTPKVTLSALLPIACVYRPSLDNAKKTTKIDPFTNSLGKVIILTKHQIRKRSRQISIGKKTKEYIDYVNTIPKSERVIGKHLQTPNPKRRISKRRFHGKVSNWRRFLHHWNGVTASKVVKL